jgi:hypothetical protein
MWCYKSLLFASRVLPSDMAFKIIIEFWSNNNFKSYLIIRETQKELVELRNGQTKKVKWWNVLDYCGWKTKFGRVWKLKW